MLQAYASPGAFRPESAGHRFHPFHGVSPQHTTARPGRHRPMRHCPTDEAAVVEWSEDDIVFPALAGCCRKCGTSPTGHAAGREARHPALVFTEREKEAAPSPSSAACGVVGCSPAVADRLLRPRRRRRGARPHPQRPEDLAQRHPGALPRLGAQRRWPATPSGSRRAWPETRQWINEQLKQMSVQGDLFA